MSSALSRSSNAMAPLTFTVASSGTTRKIRLSPDAVSTLIGRLENSRVGSVRTESRGTLISFCRLELIASQIMVANPSAASFSPQLLRM